MTNQSTDPGFSIDDFVLGHLTAFAQAYAHYHPGLVRFARELVQDNGIVQAVVTDAFLKLWIQHADLSTLPNIEAFLHVGVQRACFGYLAQVEQLNDMQLQKMREAIAGNAPTEKNSEAMKAIILGWFNDLPDPTNKVARLAWDSALADNAIAARLTMTAGEVQQEKRQALLLIKERWFSKTEKELAAFRDLLEKARK